MRYVLQYSKNMIYIYIYHPEVDRIWMCFFSSSQVGIVIFLKVPCSIHSRITINFKYRNDDNQNDSDNNANGSMILCMSQNQIAAEHPKI